MKKLIALCAFSMLLCSCAGINVKKPDIDNVKKIAILSVTSNEEYQDVEVAEGKKESLLGMVGNIIKDNVEMINEGQVDVVTHGAKALFQALNGIEGWTVIPFEEVLNNESVAAAFGNEDKSTMEKVESFAERIAPKNGVRHVMPKGMYEITYDDVEPPGNTWVNGERIEAPMLRKLGKLCGDLGVDAVAIAEYTFYYETGMMTTLTSNVTPIGVVNVVLVDKNGEKILYTDRGWKKFEGSESARINRNYVDMHSDKSIKAYKALTDDAMEAFRKEAAKQLAK